ncbi:MAG: hypothetical protein HYV34_00655 [Candidatus Kerfeldbacteria bacterium]|nr:hypothetical protein [Candidatus Kerfeldbacteria bacterium]
MKSTYSQVQIQPTPARDIFESTLLGYFGIALILGLSLVTGLTPPLFLVATLLLAIPIIRTPESGLHILILATMTFEHLFALQPIMFGDHQVKLFLFDITLALTGASALAHARIRSLQFPVSISITIQKRSVLSSDLFHCVDTCPNT